MGINLSVSMLDKGLIIVPENGQSQRLARMQALKFCARSCVSLFLSPIGLELLSLGCIFAFPVPSTLPETQRALSQCCSKIGRMESQQRNLIFHIIKGKDN